MCLDSYKFLTTNMDHLTFLFAGASSSIARETCVLLRKKGHEVIGMSRGNIDGHYNSVHKVERYTPEHFPVLDTPLHGVVYFPGTINLKPLARLTQEDFQNDFEINALGAVSFIQAYLTNLKSAKTASIVMVSSVAAQTGLPFHSSIAMAKGAVEGLTRALAAELAPSIRVNCVAPSLVDTPMALKFIDSSEKIEQMKKRNPMRKVGEPGDIANTIAFLLTQDTAWITGQVIAVDGGMGSVKN